MTVTVTDLRSTLNEADATTSWTGSPALFTGDPDPIEATGHIGYVVSSTTVDAFVAITSTSFTGKVIYVWVKLLGAMDTLANGGAAIEVGDGTNRVSYHLAGSDVAGFRHNSGEPQYMCLVLHQASLPSSKTVRAGSEGSLNWGAITQVGAMFKTLAKSKGGVANCFVDVIRLGDLTANNGGFLDITGGASGGTEGKWSQIATEDRSTATAKALGVIHELGSGLFGVQGPLRFGNATGSSSSWFEDTNVAVAFESRGMGTGVYGIYITDNGTGTTTFKLGTKVGSGVDATGTDGCTLIVPSGVGGYFDSRTDTDVTDVFIYATLFSGFTGGVSLGPGQELIDCRVTGSGVVTAGGAVLLGTAILGSTAAANASALVWNSTSDTDGNLDRMKFSKGTNAHHAITLGASSVLPNSGTVTLRGISFSGFNASDAQNDSAILLADTGSNVDWVINAVGTSGTVSVKKTRSGDTFTVVSNPVTLTVTVVDLLTGDPIENVNVLVEAASGGSMTPGDDIIKAFTDSNGEVSDTRTYASNQPITGRARLASGVGPYYKTGSIAGTVDSTSGLSLTVQMILDI